MEAYTTILGWSIVPARNAGRLGNALSECNEETWQSFSRPIPHFSPECPGYSKQCSTIQCVSLQNSQIEVLD